MSVCSSVCLSVCAIESQGSKGGLKGARQSPIVFEASHWPSDHMTKSRPLPPPRIHRPSATRPSATRPSATRPSCYTRGALKMRGGCTASIGHASILLNAGALKSRGGCRASISHASIGQAFILLHACSTKNQGWVQSVHRPRM